VSVGGEAYAVGSEWEETPEFEFRVLPLNPGEAEEIRLAQARAILDILRWVREERAKRLSMRGDNG
jgi:hypothetical protein